MGRHVIIQESVFKKGQRIFNASKLQVYRFHDEDEDVALQYQKNTGAMCIIVGAGRFTPRFFNSLKPGTLMIRYGVGYENIPVTCFKERNLLAANTPGTLDVSVAEHAMTLMLASARGIINANKAIDEGRWTFGAGLELRGKVLAIIGFGNIGVKLAKIAKMGFDMRIHAFGRRKVLSREHETLADLYSQDIRHVLGDADFVSLHIPANKETSGFIDSKKLAMMKKNATLINTSRGRLVRECDLYEALVQGRIASAALDVFCQEPYSPIEGKDLRKLPNVIMTPHISSNTKESNERMADACVKNCVNYYERNLTGVTLIPELRDRIR